MIIQLDTRITRTPPRHLTPPTDHERSAAKLRREARRALWHRLAVRLFDVAKRGPKATAPLSPPS